MSTRMTWSAPSGATRGSASAGATSAPSVHMCRLLIGGSQAVGWGNVSAQPSHVRAAEWWLASRRLGQLQRPAAARLCVPLPGLAVGGSAATRERTRQTRLSIRTWVLLSMPGFGYSNRLRQLLACGSAVVHVQHLESEVVFLYSKSFDRLPLYSAVFIASLVFTRRSEDSAQDRVPAPTLAYSARRSRTRNPSRTS